jgi:2-polyprenyl-3-methyl-5-hydroxy-6-metoxy-1,4-benzoquinol methylase
MIDEKRAVIKRESELAKSLLAASDTGRQELYGTVYDEMYRTNLGMAGPAAIDQTFGASPAHLPTLRRLTGERARILEIGCGTGYLSLELSKMGHSVTAVDVSAVAIETAIRHARGLGNRPTFMKSSGVKIPFEGNRFDFAFSVEVLEHIHEWDVPGHFEEILRVLKPGGSYWVSTPNRLTSPSVNDRWGVKHDEEEELCDVHLKEWTYEELAAKMRGLGFEELRSPLLDRQVKWLSLLRFMPLLPVEMKMAAEKIMLRAPKGTYRILGRVCGVSSCSIVAHKPLE